MQSMWDRQALQGSQHSLLEARGIGKAFRRVPVLFPLSFSLEPGDGLALLGPNGSGKTTLLRILAGLVRPTVGALRLCGRDLPFDASAGHLIGFAGHESHLYDDLTAIENLRFFASFGTERFSDFDLGEALAAVGLGRAACQRVGGYSAGMKRRLGFARILLLQPMLLLLDEPHASLDPAGQELVDEIVQTARAAQRTVIIASHDQERAARLCNRTIVLDGGRVLFQGDSSDWTARAPVRLVQEGPGG